ncbi:hypothetical protein ACQP2T_21345 [Nonomuraea sp. CA-143628]|uniref:hypothetical protein n=1 Tax=Nonomuraea sp. CA-143628 TaxID=3239997 RepID=UPI003D8E87A3
MNVLVTTGLGSRYLVTADTSADQWFKIGEGCRLMKSKRVWQAMRNFADKALLNLPVTALLGMAVPGLGVAVSIVEDQAHTAVVVALLICAMLAGLSIWLRHTSDGGYKEVAARLARTLSGGGLPVILALGRLCSKDNRGEADPAADFLIHQIVTAARRTCSHAKQPSLTKAAYYKFEPDGYLHLKNALWGSGSPRRTLGVDGDHDKDLLQFALNPMRVKRVDDISREDCFLDVLEMGTPGYRSCIASSVGVKEAGLQEGLLVVVSPEAKAFEDSDVEALRLLGGALAAGLAHVHGL